MSNELKATKPRAGCSIAGWEKPPGAAPLDVARTRAAMLAQAAEQSAKLSSVTQQIAQKQAEAGSVQAAIAKIDASLPMVQETADIRRKAKEIQYGNQIAFLEAQTRLVDQQSERLVQQRKLVEIEAARLAREVVVLLRVNEVQDEVGATISSFVKYTPCLTKLRLLAKGARGQIANISEDDH